MKIYATLSLIALSFGIAFTFDECDVPADHRENCGWPGVNAETCVEKGCCFDSSVLNTIWCFKKAPCVIYPANRRECGFPGISRKSCEVRGCCYDSSIQDALWCFQKRDW